MDRLRIAHTSDLHLGSDSPASAFIDGLAYLSSVLATARACSASMLVIAGDLFDSPRVDDEIVARTAQLFGDSPIPCVILPGNHDCLVAESAYFRPGLPEVPGVHIFTSPGGETLRFPDIGLSVWGRPHVGYDDFSPLDGMKPGDGEPWHLCVAHGYFVDDNHDFRSWQITSTDLEGAPCDYVMLGHLEGFGRAGGCIPPAYYSGSPKQTRALALVELQDSALPAVRQVPLQSLDSSHR